jgi:hypothetical protein
VSKKNRRKREDFALDFAFFDSRKACEAVVAKIAYEQDAEGVLKRSKNAGKKKIFMLDREYHMVQYVLHGRKLHHTTPGKNAQHDPGRTRSGA